jgi:hypothetical protein
MCSMSCFFAGSASGFRSLSQKALLGPEVTGGSPLDFDQFALMAPTGERENPSTLASKLGLTTFSSGKQFQVFEA